MAYCVIRSGNVRMKLRGAEESNTIRSILVPSDHVTKAVGASLRKSIYLLLLLFVLKHIWSIFLV